MLMPKGLIGGVQRAVRMIMVMMIVVVMMIMTGVVMMMPITVMVMRMMMMMMMLPVAGLLRAHVTCLYTQRAQITR